MNSTLAFRIGRPDLSHIPVDFYGGTSGIVQGGAGMSVGASKLNAEGRLTAGVLFAVTVAIIAFHIWTRDIQA